MSAASAVCAGGHDGDGGSDGDGSGSEGGTSGLRWNDASNGLLVVLGEWCRRFGRSNPPRSDKFVDCTYRATEPFMITSIVRDTVLVLEVW